MRREPLPTPVTREEQFLHDIATSLRTLAGWEDVTVADSSSTVPLREPAADGRVKHLGGGVYAVTVGGEQIDKVRGRETAERVLSERLDAR